MAPEQTINVKKNEAVGVTKMSVNQICGKRIMGDICVILGKASGLKTGEGTDGQVWCALTGTFQGTNLQTGETFRSGKLFLPTGVQETVEGAVRQLPGFADGKPTGEVTFGIGFRRVAAENPIGYSYQTVNLLPTETVTDELATLIQAASVKVPKLVEVAPETAKQIAAPVAENPVVEMPKAEAPKTQAGKAGKNK